MLLRTYIYSFTTNTWEATFWALIMRSCAYFVLDYNDVINHPIQARPRPDAGEAS